MKGFTLPLSPDGDLSLVPAPPWHFGGEQIEVIYYTDYEAARVLVPEALSIEGPRAIVSVVISRMISTPSAEAYAVNPERAQYSECLVKVACQLKNGNLAWYVPISWVSKDFSLLRGFVLGFGKRLATIALTEFHEHNPVIGVKRAGSHMRGICEAFGDTRVVADFVLSTQVERVDFSGMPFIVNRHYPTPNATGAPEVNRLFTLEVGSYNRSDIWIGTGALCIDSTHPAVQALQPIEYITARSFREGFTLAGGRPLTDKEV